MQPDETNLVERSKGRDLSAFNQIVERYQLHVFNLAARILGDRAAAEDVSQETFISAFRAIDGFRGAASVRGCFVLPPTAATTPSAQRKDAPRTRWMSPSKTPPSR
jgi:RNA polymerase sigma factor (sigma-70 family)